MPRLGVLGTMVWDSIYTHAAEPMPAVEAWGGIAYSLAAADAALGSDWTVFPILKVGRDMREPVDEFLGKLCTIESLDGIRGVPEDNNRVELFYQDPSRRCERLTGGVPGWSAEELLPILCSCDALYVNFVAGWEIGLEAAVGLRAAVEGPVYADIHSLMLGLGEDGHRTLQPLADWENWLDAFDVVQLNEDELITLADGNDHPWELPRQALSRRTRAVLVTRGRRGVRWIADPDLLLAGPFGSAPGRFEPETRSDRDSDSETAVLFGEIETDRIVEGGDPTGCGDVWGATCFAKLVSGADLEAAMRHATRAAGLNAGRHGAEGLADALRAAGSAKTGAALEGRGR